MRRSRSAGCALPSRQRGQALVFATITVAVVLLAMLVMVSSGQLTTEKMRLQNTGDAAAYSGALALSRDYNFSAYTNRAMVANQVAIAQWVGMTSWARHNKQVFNRTVFSLVPCATALIGTPTADALSCLSTWNSYGSKARSFSSNVESVAGKGIPALNDLIGALSTAQSIYHYASLAAVPLLVNNVIKANDPDAALASSITNVIFEMNFLSKYQNFSRTYGNNNLKELERFADVTHRSLDAFSGSNGAVQRVSLVPFPVAFQAYGTIRSVPGIAGNGGTMLLTGEHTGGTELTKDFKTWNALDASTMTGYMQFWTGCASLLTLYYPTCWNYAPIGFPLGWDGAHAGPAQIKLTSFTGDNYLHTAQSYGTVAVHVASVAAAVSGLYPPGSIGTYSGLRPYQELSNLTTGTTNGMKNVDATAAGSNIPSVVIEVEKVPSAIRTTANMGTSPNGNAKIGATPVAMRIPDKFAGAKGMRVVSGAEVYFARPTARSDGVVEWPSLFNPYWQARLRDTHSEATLSAALQ